MKKVSLFLMVCLLAGCESYAEKMNEFAPAAGAPSQFYGQEMTFKDHLAAEYMAMASIEHNERYDYQCAAHFTNKGKRILAGEFVAPDNPRYKNIPQAQKEELLAARSLLIESITTQGRPENRQALAVAQTRYDCWVDQSKDLSHQPSMMTCDDDFYEAMSSVYEQDAAEQFFGDDLSFFI